jgi:membrane-bound serine protease (ClpP class)
MGILASLADGSSADWIYSLALLILGFVLVLMEIFVIPGLNIFGLIGFLSVVAGVSFAYIKMGFAAAAVVAAIGMVGTAILIRTTFKMRSWQRLILGSKMGRESGYNSAKPGRDALIGQRGEALTPLRPAGRARFGDGAVDVVSEGGFVERGAEVAVVKVAGNRVVVQLAAKIETDSSEELPAAEAGTTQAET